MTDPIKEYLLPRASTLLAAAQQAYSQLGRGALSTIADHDDGNGKTGVHYIPSEMLKEDDDPTYPFTQTYNPEAEAILIVMLEKSEMILIYEVGPSWLISLRIETAGVHPHFWDHTPYHIAKAHAIAQAEVDKKCLDCGEKATFEGRCYACNIAEMAGEEVDQMHYNQ